MSAAVLRMLPIPADVPVARCRWTLTQAPVFLPQSIPVTVNRPHVAVPAPYPVTAPSALPLYPYHNRSPSLSPSTQMCLCPYLKQSLSLYLKPGPFLRLYQYRNTSQSLSAYLIRYSRWCHPLARPFENSGHAATRWNTYSFRAGPSWSCPKAVCKPVWHIPLLSVQRMNSWWWTKELSETVSC
jgi:hypothetical protein